MTSDDRHHSRRTHRNKIWDVLLRRVRGPKDTSQDLCFATTDFGFGFKAFQNHAIPLVTDTSWTNHESSPPRCNAASWVEWNAVTHPASSEEILSWLSALVALDRDTGDTNIPEIWMDNYQGNALLSMLWSPISPGHELHFGPADLVHLSILFYLKVRQKK